jgi:hypothetical protein
VNGWIKDCEENHEECRSHAGDEILPVLPARVIDVGPEDGSEEPKLLQTISNAWHGEWAALSYKWGTTAFMRLLGENLPHFEYGISMTSMPRTFQDAIRLTRRLGLRYLWIDALCIIQDSEEDWREQSSQMPNIYASAYITIASAANGSPLEGLFGRRDYDYAHSPPVKLHLGSDGVLEFTMRRPLHSLAGYNEKQPWTIDHLFDRGWCLQEKILSRRLLTFHPTEVSFACGQHILMESYYEQDPAWQLKQRGPFGANMQIFADGDGAWRNDFSSIVGSAALDGQFRNRNRDMVLQQRKEEAEQGRNIAYMNNTPELTNLQKLQERWYSILQDYNNRQLTYGRDKLVAISGVAKYILKHSGLNDEYHAGIFKSMLPHALMWRIPQQKRQNDPWMNTRPEKYRAPSWSWASMEGYLDFERCWKYVEEPATCEVVGTGSTPLWNDTSSAVSGGKVVIRGKCKTGLVNAQNDYLCHPAPEEMGSNRGSYVGVGIVHLDDRPEGDRLLVCLELFKCQGLLLVEREGEERVFERVGIYSMSEFWLLLSPCCAMENLDSARNG